MHAFSDSKYLTVTFRNSLDALRSVIRINKIGLRLVTNFKNGHNVKEIIVLEKNG